MTHSALIVGTGFSGIALAIELKKQGVSNFILLEKADDVGGTWRENTYPGAECDIPSALYSFSFEPYPDWEYKWSHQPQILNYLRLCAKKYGLYPHIRFGQVFTGATWQENRGTWRVETQDGATFECRHLVTAVGQLHVPNIPEFEGLRQYKGVLFHSAKWNHDVSLKEKRVGVVGNAASAIQFIPEIAPIAREVIVFQRSANWVLPKQDRLYADWEKALVRRLPFLLKLYRFRIWALTGGLFFMMKRGNEWLRKYYEKKVIRYINKSVDDPKLRQKLIPDYPLGAKRILFSDNYYTALNRPNVRVVTSGIQSLTQQGIATRDGKEYPLDVVILATGFRSNPLLAGLDIRGRSGQSLAAAWHSGVKNYLGMMVSGFPNFYMMYGPNTNLGHSSILLMSESQAHYIAQCVATATRKGWHSLDVRPDAMAQYFGEIQRRLEGMIWNQIQTSWYKAPDGTLPNNWPGRTIEYRRRTRKPVFGDFQIRMMAGRAKI